MGKVVAVTPSNCKIKTLEVRGRGRPPGEVWTVPFNFIDKVDADGLPVPQKLEYDPFDEENGYLELLATCYTDLSPEHLSGDGTLSGTRIRQRRATIERRIKGLTVALGRSIGELELYEWADSKREYMASALAAVEKAKSGNKEKQRGRSRR